MPKRNPITTSSSNTRTVSIRVPAELYDEYKALSQDAKELGVTPQINQNAAEEWCDQVAELRKAIDEIKAQKQQGDLLKESKSTSKGGKTDAAKQQQDKAEKMDAPPFP